MALDWQERSQGNLTRMGLAVRETKASLEGWGGMGPGRKGYKTKGGFGFCPCTMEDSGGSNAEREGEGREIINATSLREQQKKTGIIRLF